MEDSGNEILNYNLFGEQSDLPDVVHCETIEARSRLHDWEFAPHRHGNLHQVLLLERGRGTVGLDGVQSDLTPNSFVNVPVGTVHSYRFAPATQGHVLTIPSELLSEMLRDGEGLRPALARAASGPAGKEIPHKMREIVRHFAGRGFARAHMLRALTATLIGHIAQSLHVDADLGKPGESNIIARLQAMIDAEFHSHQTVADYARKLGISPTHLSRIARRATGRPASKLIEERLIREARRNLVYTNLGIATIAYELGYDDPAYFSRVFSRATGMSPREFRARPQEHRLKRPPELYT